MGGIHIRLGKKNDVGWMVLGDVDHTFEASFRKHTAFIKLTMELDFHWFPEFFVAHSYIDCQSAAGHYVWKKYSAIIKDRPWTKPRVSATQVRYSEVVRTASACMFSIC